MDIIRAITDAQLKSDLPQIKSGDTVKVAAKVVEGTRERIQTFEGTVMRMHGGGLGLTITVRRIASGVGLKVVAWNRSPRPDAAVPIPKEPNCKLEDVAKSCGVDKVIPPDEFVTVN